MVVVSTSIRCPVLRRLWAPSGGGVTEAAATTIGGTEMRGRREETPKGTQDAREPLVH